MKFLKITGISFLVCCIVGLIGWLFYTQLKSEIEQEEKEDYVWLARCELETLRRDTEVGFLRLADMDFQDNFFKIKFKSFFVPDETLKKISDEKILDDFLALVFLHPEKWSKAADYLMQAPVDLQIIYNTIDRFPLIISAKRLHDMLADEKIMRKAKERFIEYKQKEVLIYARNNFNKDRYLHIDTLLLEKNSVSLQLLYDDSKYKLGHTYTNPKEVPVHFTDKVGDMGSILNGMLSICVRTNKGFSFIYRGTKRHKLKRCTWNAEKAKEMYHELNENLWLDHREVNRSTTIIHNN